MNRGAICGAGRGHSETSAALPYVSDHTKGAIRVARWSTGNQIPILRRVRILSRSHDKTAKGKARMKTGMAMPDAKSGETHERPGYGPCTLLEVVPKGGNVSNATSRNWGRADAILCESVDDGRTFLWSILHPAKVLA
jgi:hypothetical protein